MRRRDRPARDQFVRAVVREARLEHGIDVNQLVSLLRAVHAPAIHPAVAVVECSRTQCEDLAGQIERRWQVKAVPWVLGDAEAPRGVVVGTYFHYNDIRRLWPKRVPDVRFLPIVPEPGLADRLAGGRHADRGSVTVVLCERDEAMARNIAADLIRILPAPKFRVITRVVANAGKALMIATAGAPVLFSPRLWGELSERARRDPRVSQVRYVFETKALDALGAEEGWEPL